MRDPSRKYEAGPRTEPDKLWCDNLARRWHCVIFLPQTLIKLQQWLIQCEMKWSNIIRDHRFINVFQNIHFVLNQMISICVTTETQQTHQIVWLYPSNVFVFCRSLLVHIPSWKERLWCSMSVALRKGNEVRPIFVCLFKWIHPASTVGAVWSLRLLGIRVIHLDVKARHDF